MREEREEKRKRVVREISIRDLKIDKVDKKGES